MPILQKSSKRLAVIQVLLVLWMALIGAKLFWLQVKQHDSLLARAENHLMNATKQSVSGFNSSTNFKFQTWICHQFTLSVNIAMPAREDQLAQLANRM